MTPMTRAGRWAVLFKWWERFMVVVYVVNFMFIILLFISMFCDKYERRIDKGDFNYEVGTAKFKEAKAGGK